MDNIDKTLILSYPRTGSTALVDVYRSYLKDKYPDTYFNIPSEPLEGEQFFNLTDYLGKKYPFYHFCKKHNLPIVEVNNLLSLKDSADMNLLGDSIFKAVLSEPFFAVKIFPKHINLNYDIMKQVLLDHIDQGNNLICLYRRNFSDTISSIISCTVTKLWVSITAREDRIFVPGEEINLEKVLSDDHLDPNFEYNIFRTTVNGLRTWYNMYRDLSKEYKNIKLVAYEDIKNFDSNFLSNLHNVDIGNYFETRVKLQHYKEQQDIVFQNHKHLLDQVLTSQVMKELPLNSNYEVIP